MIEPSEAYIVVVSFLTMITGFRFWTGEPIVVQGSLDIFINLSRIDMIWDGWLLFDRLIPSRRVRLQTLNWHTVTQCAGL